MKRETFVSRRHVADKKRLDAHSRERAYMRYQLEQHEIDLVRKRVRRFFREGRQCHNKDIVVLQDQSHHRVRIAILVNGEWVHAVYHIRYCLFVTFLPFETVNELNLPSVPARNRAVVNSGFAQQVT